MPTIKIPERVGCLIDLLRTVPGVPGETPLEVHIDARGFMGLGQRDFTVRWEYGIVAEGRAHFWANGGNRSVSVERLFLRRNFYLGYGFETPEEWHEKIALGMLDPTEWGRTWTRKETSAGCTICVEMKLPNRPGAK